MFWSQKGKMVVYSPLEKAQDDREGSGPKPCEALLRTPFRRHPTACLWNQELICPPASSAFPEGAPAQKNHPSSHPQGQRCSGCPRPAGGWMPARTIHKAQSVAPANTSWPLPPDRQTLRSQNGRRHAFPELTNSRLQPSTHFPLHTGC